MMKKPCLIRRIKLILIILLFLSFSFKLSNGKSEDLKSETVFAQTTENAWPMLAANPERTSHSPEEIAGNLYPKWSRPFRTFINGKIQVIAANNLLYIATARGVYALSPANGDILWVYPMELPAGHSPTVVGNKLYIAGMDHKIHVINANPNTSSLTSVNTYCESSFSNCQTTQYKLNNSIYWTYEARGPNGEIGAGFEVNPLVVKDTQNGTPNPIVFAGNRNGYFYAIRDDGSTGTLLWRYKTDAPIRYSAAYKGGVVYFASTDSYAYALNATNGSLVWKSTKLPSAGFNTYWPVIYTEPVSGTDYVIFAGTLNFMYTSDLLLGSGNWTETELFGIWPTQGDGSQYDLGPTGNEPYKWVSGTKTIDATKTINYYRAHPERRKMFVLNRSNGQEFRFDPGDGNATAYAPFLWMGTQSGNRYPPVVGSDGVLYASNEYISAPYIGRSQVTGWKFGTKYLSIPTAIADPTDEPIGYAVGGNTLYYSEWFSNQGGAYNLATPNTRGPSDYTSTREWIYYDYDLGNRVSNLYLAGRGSNRVYGYQALNPPIPYNGMVYTNNAGVIVAWSTQDTTTNNLAVAEIAAPPSAQSSVYSDAELKQKLENEVQKMVNAGHLRPGYHGQGLGDWYAAKESNYLGHYFSNEADTIDTLTRALPYLSSTLQAQTKTYLQSEVARGFPAHMGWSGAQRESYDTLPEIQAKMNSFGTRTDGYNPNVCYALWKYALAMGYTSGSQLTSLLNTCKSNHQAKLSDSTFASYPYLLNSWIAGDWGYVELQKLAGGSVDRSQLDYLLNLRVNAFNKDSPSWSNYPDYDTQIVLSSARNFMNMTPELGKYLHDNAFSKMQTALKEYQQKIPGWFVSKYDATAGEGTITMLYDYNALFLGKALVLKESREELSKYLDAPAFEKGDLFYIQNLVAAIEAPSSGQEPTPTSAHKTGDLNRDGRVDITDLVIVGANFGTGNSQADANGDGIVNINDLVTVGANFGR